MWAGVIAVVIIVIGVAGGWYFGHAVKPFPINSQDHLTSWSFKGAYTGNDTLIAQATADSAKLKGELGKGNYPDYDLYIGIGNDADLLGDGKAAYNAYDKAISLLPNQGLAYVDLAHTMDELGAYHTAADAYAAAVHAQSGMLEYHVERLNFLTRQFPDDTTAIQAALKDVSDQFGDTPAILAIEAQWLEAQGKYADAIKAWQADKALSTASSAAAIDAQIARDRAKE